MHRSPPLPATMKERPHKGTCRWCGKPVAEKRRLWWHSKREEEYHLVSWPHAQYRALIERDGHRCAKCGKDAGEWDRWHQDLEIDHVIELVDAPRELKYWTLWNLQLLCHKCHVAKTARSRRNRNRRANFRGLNLLPDFRRQQHINLPLFKEAS